MYDTHVLFQHQVLHPLHHKLGTSVHHPGKQTGGGDRERRRRRRSNDQMRSDEGVQRRTEQTRLEQPEGLLL